MQDEFSIPLSPAVKAALVKRANRRIDPAECDVVYRREEAFVAIRFPKDGGIVPSIAGLLGDLVAVENAVGVEALAAALEPEPPAAPPVEEPTPEPDEVENEDDATEEVGGDDDAPEDPEAVDEVDTSPAGSLT